MKGQSLSRENNSPIRNQPLVKVCHGCQIVFRNFKAVDVDILNKSLLLNALGKRDHVVLQRPPNKGAVSISAVRERSPCNPPHKQLRGRATVRLGEADDLGVPHPHRPGKRGVRLHVDVVTGARLADGGLRVERVHLDLVDDRVDLWARRDELLNLAPRVTASVTCAQPGRRCLLLFLRVSYTPGRGAALTCLTPKLLTPAILTSPAPTASSRARQLVRRASLPP